jgi:lipopolysaccharide export system permease protein
MVEGATQTLSRTDARMAVTRFSDFTLDLAGLVDVGGAGRLALDGLPTASLLWPTPELLADSGADLAHALEEGHTRLASPLLAVAASLLGFAALMLGDFSRFGPWRQVGLGVGLLIAVQMVWTWASGQALQSAAAWSLLYLAPLSGLVLALALLAWGQRPRRLRPAAAPGVA